MQINELGVKDNKLYFEMTIVTAVSSLGPKAALFKVCYALME